MTTRANRLRLAAPVVCALSFLAGCSGSGGGDSPSNEAGSASSQAEQRAAVIAAPFDYGTHEPNGAAAFKYMVGPEGTWKNVSTVQYEWNYYDKCATDRPFDKSALLASADGTRFFTAPDANCNLLWDANADGQLDAIGATQAFYEHNGRGSGGQQLAAPFTNFWFDDNWLARYATRIYGHAAPDGLREAPHVRWRILEGDTTGWTRYPDDTFDRRALNGIHDVAVGDFATAAEEWQRILDAAGVFYDSQTQRYVYPNIDENYHLALFEILTSLLMDRMEPAAGLDDELVQHWVSLRSNILSRQERRGDELLGWRSSFSNLGSLMNTETMSLNVLALGAGAVAVFEAGEPPLRNVSPAYYIRTADHVLAARVGTAQPGYMTVGPAGTYPAGEYEIQFFMRAGSAAGAVARLEIADAGSAAVLADREVTAADLPAGAWRRVSIQLALDEAQTKLEVGTYWYGTGSLDVAAIRIRRL